MPSTQEDLLFGRVVVHNGLATQDQVKECLSISQREGKDLGDVLLAKGFLNEKQLQAVRGHLKKRAQTTEEKAARKEEEEGSAKAGGKQREDVVTVADVASMDFSHLAEKPLQELLSAVREIGVSDLHCHSGSPPFVRHHGQQVYLKHPPYEAIGLENKIQGILGEREKEELQKRLDVDFCLETGDGRYRTSVYKQRLGTDAVFRVIPDHIPTLEELHLPDYLRRFTRYNRGIVLLTGPAGCGKSSTAAALVEIINQERNDHVVTAEDPIEFVFESKNCNVNQRQVGVHTEDFATALRSALRADPDVIVIGEMRDLETFEIAIRAAETGHLVLATLHTTTAVRSVDRIIDVFPPKEQGQIRAMVSESICGVVSQQLLPRKDGTGREPCLEIMFATRAVANLIRDNKTFQLPSVLQTGARAGMRTMDDSIQELLNKGIITRETARYHATSPERFK